MSRHSGHPKMGKMSFVIFRIPNKEHLLSDVGVGWLRAFSNDHLRVAPPWPAGAVTSQHAKARIGPEEESHAKPAGGAERNRTVES